MCIRDSRWLVLYENYPHRPMRRLGVGGGQRERRGGREEGREGRQSQRQVPRSCDHLLRFLLHAARALVALRRTTRRRHAHTRFVGARWRETEITSKEKSSHLSRFGQCRSGGACSHTIISPFISCRLQCFLRNTFDNVGTETLVKSCQLLLRIVPASSAHSVAIVLILLANTGWCNFSLQLGL